MWTNTRLDIRLDENDQPKPGEEPINRVDQTCYRHDLDYRDAGEDLSRKHEADRIMLKMLNEITNPTLRKFRSINYKRYNKFKTEVRSRII